MDLDEYCERSIAVAKGFSSLLGDMYAAIDEDSSLEEVNNLLERANIKIVQYENVLADCNDAWKKDFNDSCLRYIEKAHRYIKELREKYGLEQGELNSDEYTEHSMLVSKGLEDLFSERYETIDPKGSLEKITQLLETANKTVDQYESVLANSSPLVKEELKHNYANGIKKTHEFIQQLKEKQKHIHFMNKAQSDVTTHENTMYYMLECYGLDTEEDIAALGSWPQFEGINWNLGRKIEKEIPTPILIELDPDNPGIMLPMFYSGVLLFSDEMIGVLHKIGVTNFQCFDAVLRDTVKKTEYNNYKVINIIGLVAAANLEKSDYNTHGESALIDTDFNSLSIDESKTKGERLFRLAESVNGIVIHKDIKNALEECGIENLDFVLPEDWIG